MDVVYTVADLEALKVFGKCNLCIGFETEIKFTPSKVHQWNYISYYRLPSISKHLYLLIPFEEA